MPVPDESGDAPRAAAGRDAYVAGRDQVVVNVYTSSDGSKAKGRPRAEDTPGLGRLLFTAQLPRHSGQLSVAFGAGDTLIAAGKDSSVHRWSLGDRSGLPGAAPSPAARSSLMQVDVGGRMAVSTTAPAVAISRGAQVILLHFSEGGYRAVEVPLGTNEFLVATEGERFATYDGRGVAVRDFADGSVIWRARAPRNLATATVDSTGGTVAMAGGSSLFAGSNKVIVASQDDPRPRDFSFSNFPLGAGCQLGISPNGELVACASFREVVVARPRTGEIVHRKQLSDPREDVVPALGTRRQTLICSAAGEVLWCRGGRVVEVNWEAERNRYLAHGGSCDDIALDRATSRLAMASDSGQVDVWEWRWMTSQQLPLPALRYQHRFAFGLFPAQLWCRCSVRVLSLGGTRRFTLQARLARRIRAEHGRGHQSQINRSVVPSRAGCHRRNHPYTALRARPQSSIDHAV